MRTRSIAVFEIRCIGLDAVDRARIVAEIAKLDWSRGNRDMIDIGVLSEVAGEIGMSGRGVAAVQALHEYISSKTSLGKKLPKAEDKANEAA